MSAVLKWVFQTLYFGFVLVHVRLFRIRVCVINADSKQGYVNRVQPTSGCGLKLGQAPGFNPHQIMGYRDVGMAVPKRIQTRCRHEDVKKYRYTHKACKESYTSTKSTCLAPSLHPFTWQLLLNIHTSITDTPNNKCRFYNEIEGSTGFRAHRNLILTPACEAQGWL